MGKPGQKNTVRGKIDWSQLYMGLLFEGSNVRATFGCRIFLDIDRLPSGPVPH